MTATTLAKANAFLSTKAAPVFWDGYIACMHPNVIFDLQTGTATWAFMDLSKYTESGRAQLVKGEIGKIFNVRVVSSPFIQTFASTVTVYPTYVMWKGAYGVADLQGLRSYMVGDGASKSDPLAQRRYVWAKVAFNAIILQQDALVRIESASSLSYSW
jgi:N4-gp56 family major capsid protein